MPDHTMVPKPAIVHVITELGSGGAERMLLRVVMASRRFRHIVVSLTTEGELGDALRSVGAEVLALRMSRDFPSPLAVFRVARIIRREHPVVVQTWLYHADLIGLLAARLAKVRSAVAWNLRCSNMDLSKYRWSTRLVVNLLIWLSSRPDTVIANSGAGQRWHAKLGYRARRWELVPNGVDTTVFRPDPAARARWRYRLNVSEGETLIGMVARRDPMKDHEGMLRAVAEAASRQAGLVFVLAGRGVSRSDAALARLADAVRAPVHLIDECDDPAGLNAALDVAVLSSAFGEGFPNVVAEAMATAVPCIVTDVGDAALIVGPTGLVVPPNDPKVLADAMSTLAADARLRKQMGDAARDRISEQYSLKSAIARYEAIWERLAGESYRAGMDECFQDTRLDGGSPPGTGLSALQDPPAVHGTGGGDLASAFAGAHVLGPNTLCYADASGATAVERTPVSRKANTASRPQLLKVLQRGLPALVTIVALAVAFNRFDYHGILKTAAALRPWALMAVLSALFVGNLLACIRLKVIAGDLHHPLHFRDAFAATVLGQLAGSFFFQVIGQTLARSAVLAKAGISMPTTIVITGFERVVAAVLSLVIALAGTLYLFGHITFDLAGGGEELLEILAGIVFVGVAGATFAWGMQAKHALRATAWRPLAATYLRASFVSGLIQATTMGAYLAAALSFSHTVSLPDLVAAITLVMFGASVPISLAGWGLREVSAVYALGAIGLPYDDALVIALLIGFSSIAIMAVMALASPLITRGFQSRALIQDKSDTPALHGTFLNWVIPLFVASAVFFQIHVPVGMGKLDVNLADSLVLFGGALFVRQLLSRNTRKPSSRVPNIGIFVLLMTAVVVLAFVHGWFVDGWTAWASTNRLFGWFVLLAYGGTGALLALQPDSAGLRMLLQTFVAAGLAVAAFELVLLIAVAAGVYIPQNLLALRIEGFAQNPNAFGFELVLVVAAIIALRLSGWRHALALATAFTALYFTASRAAEGTCVILCVAAVVLGYIRARSLMAALTYAVAGVLAFALIGKIAALIGGAPHGSITSYLNYDINQLSKGDSAYQPNADRWISFTGAIQMFLAHPVFGAGLGAFVASYERQHGEFLIIHSTPLWLLAETGFAGFIMFTVPYFYVLYREIRLSLMRQADSARILLVLTLIAFGVMSQAHDLMYQRTFWFLLGAAIFSAPLLPPQKVGGNYVVANEPAALPIIS